MNSIKDISISSPREIKGVGEKTEKELINYFGTDKKVLELISKRDAFSLSKAPEINEWKASQIIRNSIFHEYDCSFICGTDNLKEIYEKLLDKLCSFSSTDFGESKLRTLVPVNSNVRIKEVRSFVRDALDLEVNDRVIGLLEEIESIEKASKLDIRDRIIITGDKNNYNRIRETFPEVKVRFVRNPRKLDNALLKEKRVFQVDNSLGLLDGAEYVSDVFDDQHKLVPEKILNFFKKNKKSILNSIKLLKELKTNLKEETNELFSLIQDMKEKNDYFGEDIKRLSLVLNNFEKTIQKIEKKVNDELEDLAREKELTLKGKDLINLLKDGENINSLLRNELKEEFFDVIEEQRKYFFKKFGLENKERTLGKELFPKEIKYPYEINKESKKRFLYYLEKKKEKIVFEKKIDLAEKLRPKKDLAIKIVKKALSYDVLVAINRFFKENNLILPEIVEEELYFKGGRNFFIDDVDPIDYSLSDVTLLTGVNSGGKTSTLNFIAQITILSHMGLGVPCEEAKIPLIDEVYYQKTHKGTADSGTFETVLEKLENLMSKRTKKIVLIDELENITEPGASAKIVAGLMEYLKENNELALVVSHMAEKIQAESKIDIQVDGIEAQGLDDELNLVLKRSPKKGFFASSTPELLVEKLSRQRDSGFFEALRNKFD